MERIVCDQVFSHLTVDNLLSSHQSGFRQLHWTVTALLRLPTTGLLKYMGGVNAVVFLDLKKVFDTVNHVSCTDERSENTPGQHGDLLQSCTFYWIYACASLRKHPFLLALRHGGRFARRNVPSGEERGETDVFAGYTCASNCYIW